MEILNNNEKSYMACFFILLYYLLFIGFFKFKIAQNLFNNKNKYGTPNSNQINTNIVIFFTILNPFLSSCVTLFFKSINILC